MKNLLLILSIFLAGVNAWGQQSQQGRLMEEANRLYTTDDFTGAISLYDSVIQAGYESAVLYFNLGNAYFKQNDIPSAILYYEKARKLDPTDEDIRFNLDLANSRIVDKMEPLPEIFLRTWWKAVRDHFSSDQWAKTGLSLFILSLIAVMLFIISGSVPIRKLSFWTGVSLVILMTLCILFSVSSYRDYSKHSSAIIFTPTVTVKSSPADNSVDLFVIHEGTKVYITDKVEGWYEVKLANGNVGWVKNSVFRMI